VGTDSRRLSPGELFVALAGPSFDGHDFVERAFDAGAAGAVVRKDFAAPGLESACLFRVADTRRALGDLASAWRREHSALVAAITGSNGKTTTKEMLAAILGRRHRVLKNEGNLNNDIGLPLSLLGLDAGHTACVVEMGMNAAGEIARLAEIAAPEVGVVTNVGPAHLGRLGSVEAVAAAKTELFAGLAASATAVVNLDDPHLAPWAERLGCRVVTFGTHRRAQVRAGDVSALGGRMAFTLALPGSEPVRVRLAAAGRHQAANAAAAAAAAWALGQGPEEVAAGLEEFRPVKGRLGLARSFWGWTVLDDTYNANPASLAAGLAALADVAGGRRRALILGDMRELGPEAESLHRQAGRLAAESGCALVLAAGERAPAVAAGAQEAGLGPESALAFEGWEELVWRARELLAEDDVVLVKGSRSARMERVAAALTTGEMG
jgi:UDP-N-acetylmuramoyl-tripeptide--D-alanyl-D-alanine ligase